MARLLPAFAALCLLVLMDHVSVASADNDTCEIKPKCRKGIILPMWMPQENLSSGDRAARGVVYFAVMLFFFLGVSIIADRFMAAIEVITSKERDITIKKPNGETIKVTVRVWNETVSNLTLMALGSSAPEIMLSVIEVCGNTFEAGALGPGTIVGSAAFNLFMIMAICVYVIPEGEVRRVKHLRVFFVTASWSVFAYLWLYLIIAQITPGRVDVAEGVVTFLFFPITVLTAYVADRRLFPMVFLSKRYRTGIHKGVMVQSEGPGDLEMGAKNHIGEDEAEKEPDELQEFEQHRHEFIEILRDLRKKHPDADMKHLEEMAEMEVMNRGPKSRAYYRIQATRKLTGGGNVIKKSKLEKLSSLEDIKIEDDGITRIYFEPGHHTVMENVGSFQVTVARNGSNLNNTVYVDYTTEDGTANAGSDYDFAEGTLVFGPGETEKSFPITIIDDDVFEEDEHFYAKLSNIRVGGPDGMFTSTDQEMVKLGTPSTMTVMILDDDHAGIYHFEEPEVKVVESIGEAHIKVVRSSGARGCVAVPYRTMDGTSKGRGVDFQDAVGEVIFENDETEKYIAVGVIDDEEYEKDEYFFIELGEPKLLRKGSKGRYEEVARVDKPLEEMTDDERVAELGRPRLGEVTKITVHITESLEFKNTVDKMLSKAHISMVVGTSSWREQFVEAITVSAGDEEGGEDDEGEEKLPSCTDYIMHFLTIFWKVLFAIVPPTEYWGGWACFTVSIMLIGLLTAFIQDIASSFGCTVGLQDSVTAISFVALGTSVPDTFASKVAAVGDKYADSSIGNVTGSNAVNVFLGIGIAWTVASIYHAANGTVFKVEAGSLGFSLTLFCAFALLCIATLLIRRRPFVGGELGGPAKYKYPTAIFFGLLWITYVVLSALVSYCHIKGF